MDKELIQKVHEMVGAVKMVKVLGSFVDAARYSLYKQLRDSKVYKALGKDWKDFCIEDLKSNQNTINQEIKLLEEYGESFLKVAERMGLTKRDLNALGSGLSEDAKAGIRKGVIEIGDLKIKESEIGEHMDDLKEAISALSKQAEETRAELKASQRVNENHHKTIEKLHKTIERHEKRDKHLEENPLAFEEDYITQMEGFRLRFEQLMDRIDPENEEIREFFRDEDKDGKEKKHRPTTKMRAHYLSMLDYMKKRATAAHGVAEGIYGTAEMMPEEVFSPK